MAKSPLETPVQFVKGVGPQLAKIFAKLGVLTVEDMLYLIPREYEDRRNVAAIGRLQPADSVVIKGEIVRIEQQLTRNRFSIVKAKIADKTGSVQAVWFNQPFLTTLLRPGMKLIVTGKAEISEYEGGLQLQVRDYEIDTGDNLQIVPRYPLTEGLYPKKVRSVVKTVLAEYGKYLADKKALKALTALHQPADLKEVEPARQYLAFEELFIFQLGLLLGRKKIKEETKGAVLPVGQEELAQMKAFLPFTLTGAQEKVLGEILADLQSGRPMNRLVQGDVGSGKTVIAALAALVAVKNGYQTALLAPTEILAQQHYRKMVELLNSSMVKIDILTATTSSDKKRAELLAADLVVGTHALLEEKVKFNNLGLVVIDEQHRFGVEQRAKLVKKGVAPHLLVMTATPIPRTLALTLYGDLDRSIIDELPPGRTPIKTHFVPKKKRKESYEFIRSKIKEGRQVFVVCPLVEESSELDLKAAKEEAQRLQNDIYPELKVGLIHGKLKGKEKDELMKAFLAGEINILVSTTVIEVGIDVPNATIMVIEHAERFGLSQLHQLRGRIGRGSEQSFCFLVGDPRTPEAKARIKAMIETTDGFKIAETDLRLRGPGDFLGVRQSGLPNFRVADIIRDENILLKARQAAEELLQKDPESARDRWESQRPAFKNPQSRWAGPALN
ncbi:MAG TPA: ATP-dependent DNA helicase RecG [Candidatus Sulfotelmatobacter sp.]|nr:ATP-dependent DNA helicase RecG [Candidatus Sulfotelmatobacter sp.]